MPFDPFKIDLPITNILEDVKQTLAESSTLIVHAPPQMQERVRFLPLALLDAPWLDGKKIIMLEPRRLAARSIAMRMAQTTGRKGRRDDWLSHSI